MGAGVGSGAKQPPDLVLMARERHPWVREGSPLPDPSLRYQAATLAVYRDNTTAGFLIHEWEVLK